MKKRIFSVMIAVVMIATAINLAPVLEVYATGGGKMNNQYSLYDADGRWDNSQYYWNDGDYSNIVADYYDKDHTNGVNKQDENFKTRHVTMFHDCDSQSIYYTGSGSSLKTNRGNSFDLEDRSNALKTYYNNAGKALEASNVKDLDDAYPPNTVASNGCDYINNSITSGYAKFKTSDTADGSGGSDCRMIFRNFYNTDQTDYNFEGNSSNTSVNPNKYSPAGKEGLNISEYDYLEFDLMIRSGAGYKRNRTGEPTSGFRVYFYYETNDATAHYLDYDSWNIDGFHQENGAYNFGNQLNFDANGNYQDFNKWVTVRIPLLDAIRYPSSGRAPTVKQVTIRIVGGTEANKEIFWVDDLRFVKNDDHVGKVYPGFDGYTAQDYPSGEYFIINDFEYESDDTNDGYGSRSSDGFTYNDSNAVNNATWYSGSDGVVRPFSGPNGKSNKTPGSANYSFYYPEYERVIRCEDCNVNDAYNHTGTSYNWAYKTIPSGKYNSYAAAEGFVTQGTYGTLLRVQNGVTYHNNSGGWYLPTYYQRHYSTPMDLSKYTHFAIDINLRYPIQDYNTGAKGVTFAIQLFQQYTMTNGKLNGSSTDHDDYNFLHGYTVKFFLPYGRDCWNETGNPDLGGSNGKVIPLSSYQPATSGYTAYGGMRLIFTVEDLLKGTQTYYKYDGISGYPQNQIRGVGYGAYCLNNINGMRFVWMNRSSDSDKRYYTYSTQATNSATSLNGRYEIMLDNFIAYTPDTSVTIKNVTNSADVALDENQQFVYDVYGGYTSTNSAYINGQLGSLTPNVSITGKYDGTDDYFTKNQSHRVSVPANGSVTIRNLPFNSYYVTQENWSWRYLVENVTCNKSDILKYSAAAGNLATILPRVSLDGSATRHVSILEVMKQRNFTLTFTQKRNKTLYLDGNGQAAVNNFN